MWIFCSDPFSAYISSMKEKKKSRLSESVVVGVIALVFLIVGYQTALFVYRASVMKIVSNRDESLSVRVAGLLVLKCNFQKLAHPTVSENGVLHALILGSVPALLHQALHFCKQSPVSF